MATIDNGGFKIICTAYSWLGLTEDLKQVNFQNKSIIPVKKGEINLVNYLLLDSDIILKGKREELDRVQDSLQLFGSYSSLNLRLSNLRTPKLSDFFNIFNTSDNKFYRYKVEMIDNGKKIFKGVLSPADLEFFFPKEVKDRKTAEITIYSWDKEVQEYASNNGLPEISESVWNANETYHGLQNIYVKNLFATLLNFESNRVDCDSGLNNNVPVHFWRMARTPRIAPSCNIFMGYDYIRENSGYTRFEFVKKLCNAMGWVFYIKYNEQYNDLFLIVRNRVAQKSFYKKRVLDFNKCKSYKIKFAQYNQTVNTIIMNTVQFIADTSIFGTAEIQGHRDLVYSNTNTGLPSDNLLFYSEFIEHEDGYLAKWYDNYVHSKVTNQENGVLTYHNYTGFFLNETVKGWARGEKFDYKTDFLLSIDGGANGFNQNRKLRMNMENREQTSFYPSDVVGAHDIIISGNLGTAMFFNSIDPPGMQYLFPNDANNYSKSAQMKANMNALLNDNSNLILEYETHGFYPDMDEYVTFINNSESPFNFEFDILDINAKRNANTTTFTLRKRHA